jgi:hypothetical protein
MQLAALTCSACKRRFGLMVGTGDSSPDNLPDPFQAICIHCEAISMFDKEDIEHFWLNKIPSML